MSDLKKLFCDNCHANFLDPKDLKKHQYYCHKRPCSIRPREERLETAKWVNEKIEQEKHFISKPKDWNSHRYRRKEKM